MPEFRVNALKMSNRFVKSNISILLNPRDLAGLDDLDESNQFKKLGEA
jgi:hypothetical protein